MESGRKAPAGLDSASNGASAIRIAIADDHPIFRDGLKQILGQERDFAVVAEARDGEEALRIIEEHRPDILLLDLNMPRAGGLGILQKLQAQKGGTKVIVLTASEDKNEFIQAMRLGAAGIVLKQSPTELLLKSIRKVHAGEIWLDSHTTAAVMRQFATGDDRPGAGGRERAPLSPREREIVALVAQGFKNKEMAGKMFISEQTVKNHLHNIFDKLGVSDRLELALYAIHKNLHQG
ncbi:MAG: response regulator transcription factor [Candidatus Solibacter usitatus]|nr:response regulator transcription factor [Candidatus Solibacter usitatus]